MKIRTEKKLVEQLVSTYIANDGKEFSTKIECEAYEEDLNSAQIRAEAEKFEIKELEDTYPLDVDAQYINDNHGFKWYRVNNKEEFNAVDKMYGGDVLEPKTYPEIICIEYDDYYGSDAWTYLLSDMKKATSIFWERHGFEVEFKTR